MLPRCPSLLPHLILINGYQAETMAEFYSNIQIINIFTASTTIRTIAANYNLYL